MPRSSDSQWKDKAIVILSVLLLCLGTVLSAIVPLPTGSTTIVDATQSSAAGNTGTSSIASTTGNPATSTSIMASSSTINNPATGSVAGSTSSVAAGPQMSSTSPPPCPAVGQRFDAASFVGGIVLCGGIVAIVFLGCKYYRSKTDRNYHQF